MCKDISELLDNQKFERIIYYLRSREIHSLEELTYFNTEDLYFIPGLTVSLAEEAQNLINSFAKDNSKNENFRTRIDLMDPFRMEEKAKDQNGTTIETASGMSVESDSNMICKDNYTRVPIAAAYADNKKGIWFSNFCFGKGKIFMDQLSDEDFSELDNQRGIGVGFKSQLEEVFSGYRASPCPILEKVLKVDLFLFAYQFFSNDSINWLKGAGIRSIKAMRGIDYDLLLNLGRMNRSIYREITGFLHNLEGQPLINSTRDLSKTSAEYSPDDIPPENTRIQLRIFELMGLISATDYQSFTARGFNIVKDLCGRKLDAFERGIAKQIVNTVDVPVIPRFLYALENLPDGQRSILISRAAGETLQEIGDRMGVSRERVRQIETKAKKKLRPLAILVGGYVLGEKRRFLANSELLEVFSKQVHVSVCSLIYKEIAKIQYLDFSDKFDFSPQDTSVHKQFKVMAREIIGNGLDFYEQIDVIEDELSARGIGELDSEDFMHYLKSVGYRFYGDFVALNQKASVIIYYDAINRYFPLDIKLDSKEENTDMIELRKRVEMRYPGLQQPKSNRALTAMITRNPRIILSGRGSFRPISKIVYSLPLLNEIRDYIEKSDLPSLYYFELFESFKGRLLAETSIDNHHLLHGILKYLFRDSFSFSRDRITKSGERHLTVDDRFVQLVRDLGRPVTKAEIKRAIPGISDFVIAFAVERVWGLIQWDTNRFNHVDNVRLDEYAKQLLAECLTSLTSYSGYTSSQLFYERVAGLFPEIIESAKIENSDNLFYVASYYLENEFRFNRKHIASFSFPVTDLTIANVSRYFLGEKESFSYRELLDLAQRYGWSTASYYNIISSLESEYVRVSEDKYMKRELLCISQSDQIAIKALLEDLTRPSGYYALFSIFDYRNFPDIGHNWNSHLLAHIIKEYDVGHRLLEPSISKRGPQRGVIVSHASDLRIFDDLVFKCIKQNRIKAISKPDLNTLLENAGIIEGTFILDTDSVHRWTMKGDQLLIKEPHE